jgi:hypothetical protein
MINDIGLTLVRRKTYSLSAFASDRQQGDDRFMDLRSVINA